MKRILLILLSCFMMLTVIGCNKGENPSTGTTDTTEITENQDVDKCPLPELDYELQTVTIHVRGNDAPVDEIGLEDKGDLLSSALYERTMATETRLNVEIQIAKGQPWGNYSQTIRDLRSSIESAFGTYDIIAGVSDRAERGLCVRGDSRYRRRRQQA